MKRIIIIFAFTTLATFAFSQENMITLAGGYAFSQVEDSDVKIAGWRINGLYEFNPMGAKFAHGFSFGYAHLSGEGTEGLQTAAYTIGSWPIYYAPKFLFGSENVKGFVKGAVGWQFSNIKREALTLFEDNDSGFTGGFGAGGSYFFTEKVFLSAEYELIWLSNSFYRDGWLNTASLGVGFRF